MAFNPQEHMMNLKGRDYLQVMWRLVWFREEHPLWTIKTEILQISDNSAVFRAEILDEAGRVISTGHGSETSKDFGDFAEKAETKAVGRALAMLGYGTQFAHELDEEARIVDSPVERKPARKKPQAEFKPADPLQAKINEVHTLSEQLDVNKKGLAAMYKIASINDADERIADAMLKALRNEVAKREAERKAAGPDAGADEKS